MADTKFTIKIDADGKQAVKGLKKVEKQAKKTEKEFKDLSDISNTIFSTKAALGFGAAIFGIGVAVKAVIEEASKMQDIAVQFEVLTGSVQGAEKAMKDLSDFAAGTPFQFEEIARAGKQLLGFGFSVDELKPRLQELGDVSAALGTPLTDLTLIFGQVKAAGKLTGERLLQLQERAVPIGPALAKTLGVAETAVKDLVSRGKVDFDTFSKAFASLNDEGGVAFGGLEKKSKTLSGRISTLTDNWKLLLAAMGKEGLPVLGSVVSGFTKIVKIANLLVKAGGKDYALKERLDGVRESVKLLEAELAKEPKSLLLTKVNSEKIQELNKLKLEEYELTKRQNEISGAGSEAAIASAKKELEAKRKLEQDKLDIQLEFDKALKNLKEEIDITPEDDTELASLQASLEEKKILKEIAAIEELEAKGFHAEALAAIDKKLTEEEIKQILIVAKANEKQDKVDKEREKQKIADRRSTLGSLTALTQSSNSELKAIGKAASLVQIGIATNEGAIKAYSSLAGIPIIGPALGAAAAGALIAFGLERSAKIAGLNKGGIVTGGISGIDSVPAMLTPGELVVPQQNFNEVVGAVASNRDSETAGGGIMEHVITFKDDAFEIIESKLIERQTIGISA